VLTRSHESAYEAVGQILVGPSLTGVISGELTVGGLTTGEDDGHVR
jgi:hypothetical protein